MNYNFNNLLKKSILQMQNYLKKKSLKLLMGIQRNIFPSKLNEDLAKISNLYSQWKVTFNSVNRQKK